MVAGTRLKKILRDKGKMEEVILRIDPVQIRELHALIDIVGGKHCELQERRPSVPSGEQELFPDSGMFLSSFRLAAIHQASRQDCLHLFHLLFDHFFLSGRMCQLPLDAMARSQRRSESSTRKPMSCDVLPWMVGPESMKGIHQQM